MHNFRRINQELFCEDVPLSTIASECQTPCYVYSKASIVNNIELFKGAFESHDVQLCYSVKSNSNLSVIRTVVEAGAGTDIVSGGELFRALKAGVDPQKIVYSGAGKTTAEIKYALVSGIGMFNVESESELTLLGSIAEELQIIAPISFRVNPDIDAGAHQYTTTAKKENKFGIPLETAEMLYKRAAAMPFVNPVGVDVHLGSPILSLEPYRKALDILSSFIFSLRAAGIDIRTLDIGGGYGIVYKDEEPFTPIQFAELIIPYLDKLECRCILEPGRFIVGNSGVLLTSITYVKKTSAKNFYICDSGMNHLIRPPLYGSFHAIAPVIQPKTDEKIIVDVVGPICESSDFFAQGRELPVMSEKSVLAVMSAGAYGFSMSSNYNSHPRPCEVLVDGSSYSVVRQRESYDDLIRGEIIRW